jgi:hypothetical protein
LEVFDVRYRRRIWHGLWTRFWWLCCYTAIDAKLSSREVKSWLSHIFSNGRIKEIAEYCEADVNQLYLARHVATTSLSIWRIKRATSQQSPAAPTGDAWLHEIKHDGFRVIARKTGERVRLYSRPGNDLIERFPLIVAATNKC